MDENRECRHCGRSIVGRDRRAVFCCRDCKDAHHAAAQRAATKKRLAGRTCTVCGKVLTTGSGKARTCSKECSVHWQNLRRQQERREKWEATKPPCAGCGGEIPSTRRVGVLYCSEKCKRRVLARRFRETKPGYMRQRKYGITPEEYKARLEAQDGRCAICGSLEPNGKGNFHVDHDHKTGEIRGLLCHFCNVGLGNFKDDRVRLEKAVRYLS